MRIASYKSHALMVHVSMFHASISHSRMFHASMSFDPLVSIAHTGMFHASMSFGPLVSNSNVSHPKVPCLYAFRPLVSTLKLQCLIYHYSYYAQIFTTQYRLPLEIIILSSPAQSPMCLACKPAALKVFMFYACCASPLRVIQSLL